MLVIGLKTKNCVCACMHLCVCMCANVFMCVCSFGEWQVLHPTVAEQFSRHATLSVLSLTSMYQHP